MPEPAIESPRSELILGGQKSGKSRQALARVRHWLDAGPGREAVLVATAVPGDADMRARIERHRAERAALLPQVRTVEEPRALAQALRTHSRLDTLVLVDCLTLWLTQLLMPPEQQPPAGPDEWTQAIDDALQAIDQAAGPVVLVSNEIGAGVVPLGPAVRAFVDAAGQLNQRMAAACERVTWMVAGLPVVVKGRP